MTWPWLSTTTTCTAKRQDVSIDDSDRLPRLRLGADWYEIVQSLMLQAEGIVVMATRASPSLLAEVRVVESLGRSDDTVLILAPGLDPTLLGALPHQFTCQGDRRSLLRHRRMRDLLKGVRTFQKLPTDQRLAAAEVARRNRRYAAAVRRARSSHGGKVEPG